MPRWIAAILFVVVSGSIGNCGGVSDEELKSFEQAIKSPRTFETRIRSGKVVDAVTSKPIVGAVVVYTWDVSMFGLESRTQKAAQYEATTDENGRYFIPNQKVTVEGTLAPDLEPEHMLVYKRGYVWYRVYHNRPQCFMEYVPNLNQKYQKENNIVKLQPWNEKLSHSEHIGIFERMQEYVGPKLEDALKEEQAIAKQEGRANNQLGQGAYKIREQMWRDKRTLESGQITKEEYIQRLSEALKTEDVEVLRPAAIELDKLGDTGGIEPLIRFLQNNLYRESFDTALATLSGVTGREDLKNTRVISERLEIVKDLESWWGRNRGRGKAEWIEDLIVNGRNDKVRMEALNNLQRRVGKSAAPYLVKLLSERGKSAGMYESALRLLSRTEDKSAIPAIKPMLYHQDIYVRRQAALTLNALGDRSGIPVMISSLESKSRNSRSVANAVLKEITGQDFAGGKELRNLSAAEEKAVLNKWMGWWKENRDATGANKVEDFYKILAGEEVAIQLRYAAMEEEEKKNPELPAFEDSSKSPRATFERFRAALLNDDVEKALSLMSYPLRENYKKIFEEFGTHRRDYAEGLGKIYFDSKLGGTLYYEMLTENDEGMFSFPIHFVKDDEGKWLITEF